MPAVIGYCRVAEDLTDEGTGDIYPAGPDRSGGRYWVVNNPPKGFPYVPRYQTDTYAVEFIPGACPDTGAES